MTGRLSIFDALDLEYALVRAAARGSVGPYSLTGSLHKLTFTQSLAFPALARNINTKRRTSTSARSTTRPLNPNESGLNTFIKVLTALILVAISFLVFILVYKYVKTWGLLVQDLHSSGPNVPTSSTTITSTALTINRTLTGFRKFFPLNVTMMSLRHRHHYNLSSETANSHS